MIPLERPIRENGYTGQYKGVFPIKVNQQEQVVETITQFGKEYNHGLEAGSKSELIGSYFHAGQPGMPV